MRHPPGSVFEGRVILCAVLSFLWQPAYNPAMTSISTSASFGSRDTCTVDRAGGAGVKYLAYTSFMAAKSFMSFRNTVVFTT